MDRGDLTGHTALITGCNRAAGIGAGIARVLAARGAAVAVCVLPSQAAERHEDGQETVDRIREDGGTVSLLRADLSDPSQCATLISMAEESLGPVDVLVNNAAHCRPDTFLPGPVGPSGSRPDLLTATSLDAHHNINVRAPALLMAEFCRRLERRSARWGRIVNVSTDGAPGFPGEVSYGATKNAMESLSRAAAREAARLGVTVNIVAPGPVQTGWITREMVPDVVRSTPLGRLGLPADVAEVVAFLVSDAARWLTGQTLFTGGGHRMV